MDIWIPALVMTGIALLVLGISALCIKLEQTLPEGEYDERQRIIRGKGWRLACLIGLVYYFCLGVYVALTDVPSAMSSVLIFGGLLVSATAWEYYCLVANAAVGRWGNPVYAIVGTFMYGGYLVVDGIYSLIAEQDRYTSMESAYFRMFAGICLLLDGILRLIRYLQERKEQ